MGFKFNIIITLSVTTLVWMPSRNTKDIFCIFITQFQKRIWQIYISVLGNIEFVFVFFNHLTEFHNLCLLGILTWKKKKVWYPQKKSSTYKKYEYGHLGRWYIESTLFKNWSSYWQNSVLCERSILYSPIYLS